MLLLTFLAGFFFGPGWGTVASVAIDNFPGRSAAVAGSIAAFGALGAVVGQPTAGLLAHFFGIQWSLIFAGLVLILAFVILARFRKSL